MKDYTSGTALVAHSAGTTSPVPHLGGADRHVFRLAAQTWLALQAIDIPPTPKNFELWFTYLGGKNAELTVRMDELLQHGHRPIAEVLELIHAECIAGQGEAHFEAIEDGAEVMEQVARETATHLAAGQRYLQDYGSVLFSVGVQLGHDQTIEC